MTPFSDKTNFRRTADWLDIDVSRVSELLSYAPETGVFTWRVGRRGHIRAGDVAGCISANARSPHLRYVTIKVDGKIYLAHRLAWAMAHGEIPDGTQIDHINGDGSDNRLCNLRPVTNKQNSENVRLSASNSSGHRGVDYHKAAGAWRARVKHNGADILVGLFASRDEAGIAAAKARQKIFTHDTGRSN